MAGSKKRRKSKKKGGSKPKKKERSRSPSAKTGKKDILSAAANKRKIIKKGKGSAAADVDDLPPPPPPVSGEVAPEPDDESNKDEGKKGSMDATKDKKGSLDDDGGGKKGSTDSIKKKGSVDESGKEKKLSDENIPGTSKGVSSGEGSEEDSEEEEDEMEEEEGEQKRTKETRMRDEPVEKLRALNAEERLGLMYTSDSLLTRPRIVEKDILWYDLLTDPDYKEGEIQRPEEVASEEDFEEQEAEEVEEIQEEEEEKVEKAEEEEEEETVVEKYVPEQHYEAPATNPDDPDDIVNQMMQQGEEGEEEGIDLAFTEAAEPEKKQSIDTFPGVVGLDLSDRTLEFLEGTDLKDRDPPYMYVSFKRIKLHIYMYQEASEFYPHRELLMHYPDFAVLVGIDTAKATGHSHFMCTSLPGRNMVLIPPKAKKKFVDAKKKEEELWKKMASMAPRKWRSLGSEIEVDLEVNYTKRPLITMHAYRYIECFDRPYEFADNDPDSKEPTYASFPSVDPEKMPLVDIMEKDIGVQVMPPKVTASTQTGFSIKRNNITQYENQYVDSELVKTMLNRPAEIFVKRSKGLQRALLQNEMMNLAKDDYKPAEEIEEIEEPEPETKEEEVEKISEHESEAEMDEEEGGSETEMDPKSGDGNPETETNLEGEGERQSLMESNEA